MTTEHDPMLKPLDLSDGRRVLVRRNSASVIRAVIDDRHKRGYEDAIADALVGVPLVLRDLEGNRVDDEFVESILPMDITAIWSVANGVDVPNPSAPSSDGTPAETPRVRARGRGSRPSNG